MSVALSADGQRVVAGTDFRVPGQGYLPPADSPLFVWDLDSGGPPHRLDGHGGRITRIFLSADGRRAVTCALDCAVVYWDLESGMVLRRLTGHKEWLWGVALSPDERYAISGGADRKMILWNLESGEVVTWLYLNGPIKALDWAGKRIAVDSGVVSFLEMES
jgi:WD40 repeat protein